MIHFFVGNLLWQEGKALVGILGVASVIAVFMWPLLLVITLSLFLMGLFFFRNPKRPYPQVHSEEDLIVCPADGRVVDIVHDAATMPEGYVYRISIFLSPLDVHVNRSPIHGVVEQVQYKPGKFAAAYLPKSSVLNERNDVVISTPHGRVMVRQIAGVLARRICWWVKPGDALEAGKTFGMIKCGSRVDLFLPAAVALGVCVGDRVYGGHTILGRLVWR